MKVYTYKKAGLPKATSIVLAYNRGHAVKMLAKALEARGMQLGDDLVSEVDLDAEKKGKVIFIEEQA